MKISSFSILVMIVTLALAGTAGAEITFEIIGHNVMANDISADGTVVVGNTEGEYETFRWTEETGVVPLGRSTAYLGSGAGAPDVSDDGTRISATILGADSTYITQGVWTMGEGWQETMPPALPDGGIMGDAYGSAWGLSGDGETLVGLYWRPGQPGGSANASSWTESGGMVGLGSTVGNSRANDTNYDGSIIVGWDEKPFGNWQSTVWRDGVLTRLVDNDWFCEAVCVSPDGNIIGGYTVDPEIEKLSATLWHWNGSGYDEQILGVLPGTGSTFGLVKVDDISADGSVAVGYNRFSNPQSATGFIWTAEIGLMDIVDFLVDNNVAVDPDLVIREVTAISDNGRVMVGIAQDLNAPWGYMTFMINLDPETAVPGTLGNSLQTARVRPLTNPSSGPTTLAMSIPVQADVDLEIFDVTGRLVKRIHAGSLQAGEHQARWDGRDHNGKAAVSGIYFARLKAGRHGDTHKFLVVR